MNPRPDAINKTPESLKTTFTRFCIAVLFSIAFGYIEAAVVVYLRAIFYPDGFIFPLSMSGIDPLWKRLMLTEIGREAATLVLIVTGATLFGRNLRQRVAYFLTIFAIWDIFYYVWLKILLNWPASLMDWDILFLIPAVWASPVLAPVIVSILMLLIAVIILYYDNKQKKIRITGIAWLGIIISGLLIIGSFYLGGIHTSQENYRDYFSWILFAAGVAAACVVSLYAFTTGNRNKVAEETRQAGQ